MTDFSKRWDKKNRDRSVKEPSQRFYDVVISGTLGMFIGIVITVWIMMT